MPSTSIYAGATDAWLQNTGSVFNTVRTAATGNFVNTSGADAYAQNSLVSTTYYISRTMLPFDTTTIGTLGATIITSATVYIFVPTGADKVTNVGDSLHVVSYSGATTPTTADFDMFGTTSFGSSSITGMSLNAYNGISLNATGIEYIKKNAVTYLGVITGGDLSGTAPTGSNQVSFRTTDQTGTSNDPYIEIVYVINKPGLLGKGRLLTFIK